MRVMTAVMTAGLLASACARDGRPAAQPAPTAPATRSAVPGGGRTDRQPLPGTEGLTKGQLLDRSLSYEGARGVVAGRVLSVGRPHDLASPDAENAPPRSVVDIAFAVTAVHGTATPPYAVGSKVTLRVPAAGSAAATEMPEIAAGDQLFVWATVQPPGGLAGPSSATVLPAPDRSNVAVVRGGEVEWLGYREPLATFVAHFAAHPVAA